MDPSSSSADGAKSSLNISFKEWRDKVSGKLDPLKTKLEKTTFQVIGISEEIETRQSDCKELATKLYWVTERILKKVPAAGDTDKDGSVKDTINALTKITSQITVFVKKRPATSAELMSDKRAETITKFLKDLDELRQQFVEVHTLEVSVQVEQMRSEMAGLFATQIPSNLPLLEVPRKPTVFYGRDDLVKSIVQLLLREETCRIPLLGAGGMGKTSVAAAAINDRYVKEKFSEGIIFLSCEGVVSADGIINALAAFLGIHAKSHARRALLAYLSSHGDILLVLDNLESALESVDTENVEQLLGALAELPRLSLIITMRGTIPPTSVEWEDACLRPLDRISTEASRQIWDHVAKKHDDKLDQLLARLDGLPLAIYLMACLGKLLAPAKLLDAYDREATKIVKLRGGGRLKSLEVSIELSIQSATMQEEPHALPLLSLISLLPDGINVVALPSLISSMSTVVTTSASVLLQVALAFDDRDRLKVLSPIRDYVLIKYPPQGLALEEVRATFMKFALCAYLLGTDQTEKAVKLLSAQFGNITSVLVHFWKSEPNENELSELLEATGQAAEFAQVTAYGDSILLLREAKTRLMKLEHWKDAADCTQKMAEIQRMREYFPEATELLNGAKSLYQRSQNGAGMARCTWTLGEMLRMQDRYPEAATMFREAKTAFEEVNARLGAAQCTMSLGEVLRRQSQYDQATQHLHDAMAVFEEMNNELGQAQCLWSLGSVLRMQDNIESSVQTFERAKTIYDRIGHRLGSAQCLQRLGETLLKENQDEAYKMLNAAKTIFEEFQNRLGAAQCLSGMADARRQQRNLEDATRLNAEAEAKFQDIGNCKGVAECTWTRGVILRIQNQYEESRAILEQAMAAYLDINDRPGVANCQESIGYALHDQGRNTEAVLILRQALGTFESVGDEAGVTRCAQFMSGVVREELEGPTGISAAAEALAALSLRDRQP
ncbi:TPR-like protein [Calocera cornea HHB12733]|uniref:TPR-like protein n=1 Tax=Calocera cornea HHB12733 TaxID=1353952 RepID=A0A165F2Q8_9BASI|nr:TPR-like protein [Calocera cornea HHB12733]